jgi:hypothetical protein
MTDGQRSVRRSVRGLAVLAGAAALGAGLIGAGSQAAMATTPGRIDGGVEDGTFSTHCLHGGDGTASAGVIDAAAYREPVGEVIRILVPWNIAEAGHLAELSCLTGWLNDAHAEDVAVPGSVSVEVSVNRVNDDSSGPDSASYSTAMGDLDTWLYKDSHAPYITYLSAWNEPNNKAYLNLKNWAPRAGGYFKTAKAAFAGHGITMVAGDFSSTRVSAANLSAYITAAGGVRESGIPTGGIWSLHPYSDIREFEKLVTRGTSASAAGQQVAANSAVAALDSKLHTHGYGKGTRLWLGEIAIYDHYGSTKKHNKITYSTAAAAAAANFLTDTTGTDSLAGYVLSQKAWPRVGRYIYLRAQASNSSKPQTDAAGLHVLQVNDPTDFVYEALTATTSDGPQS